MGGTIKRPHTKTVEKKMKKEVIKGEKLNEIENTGISKAELAKQKKLLSKMPIKEEAKPLEYMPAKKKTHLHPVSKNHKISKRTTPGKVAIKEGPDFDYDRGKKRAQRAENKILLKGAKLDHKMSKKR